METVMLKSLIRSLLLLLAVVTTSTTTTSTSPRQKRQTRGSNPNSPCYSSGGRVWVRDLHNCARYVVCNFGTAMATMYCPHPLVWSTTVKNCVPRSSRWDDCVEQPQSDWAREDFGGGGEVSEEEERKLGGRYRTSRDDRDRSSRSDFRAEKDRTAERTGKHTGRQGEVETGGYDRHGKVTERPEHIMTSRRWTAERTTGEVRQGYTEWPRQGNSQWREEHEKKSDEIRGITRDPRLRYTERPRYKLTHTRRHNDGSPQNRGKKEYARGDISYNEETTDMRENESRMTVQNSNNPDNNKWATTHPADTSFFTQSPPTTAIPPWKRPQWVKRTKPKFPADSVAWWETTTAAMISPTPKIVWWEPSTTGAMPRTVWREPPTTAKAVWREPSTTPKKVWWESTTPWWRTRTTEPSTTASPKVTTTTRKSPFARWRTTRRRKIEEDWEDTHAKRRHGNRVIPKYNDGVWWGKTTSGSLWTTTPSEPPETSTTTIRPWWAPGYGDKLPWLVPASMWVPQHQPTSPDTTTTTTMTTTPSTTTTTTTTTTPPPITSTEPIWYPRTDDDFSDYTVRDRSPEYTASVTPSVVWSPLPSTKEEDDYEYYYDEDDDDDGNTMDTSAPTTPGDWKQEVSKQQTTNESHDYDEGWQQANSTAKYYPECGVAITNMIVGGLPSAEGRWPWVVSLRLTWAQRHVCGGTLVHPQWIVTAAHCVFGSQFEDASDWRAVFGSKQPTLTSDVKSHRKIDLIVRHPEFVNGGNYPNDIAMMRLEEPVDVTGFNIRHACLPSRDNPFLADSECWIMGWGETKGFEEQSVLQELDVKIRRNNACAARWGWKRILNSHVCVGNGDGGACNGDSGGPLVCLRDGYYFLVGVTSWGVSGCQTTGYPSVFSRVSFYDKWIEGVIQTYSTFEFPLRQ